MVAIHNWTVDDCIQDWLSFTEKKWFFIKNNEYAVEIKNCC